MRPEQPPPRSGAERAPETIRAGAFVLERLLVADAPALHEAVLASLDHLRPWMVWVADEPASLEDRVALLRTWADHWAAGTEHHYGIWDDTAPGGGRRLLGVIGLMDRRGPTTRELGYWVRADATGRGVATAAARAATTAWLGVPGVEAIEVCHDAANVVSGRIPARLGFTHVLDEDREPVAPGETGVHRVWRCTSRSDPASRPAC